MNVVPRRIRIWSVSTIMGAMACIAAAPADAVSAEVATELTPVVPARLADTRPGKPLVDGVGGPGPLPAGEILEVVVAGRADVSTTAESVMLNVTAIRPTAAGYLTVYPCGRLPPTTSNVNFDGGDVKPNAVFTQVGVDGKVCVRTTQQVDVAVDVNGYVPSGGSLYGVVPQRIADTRLANGGIGPETRMAAGGVRQFAVAGRGGIPANANGVMLNITAIRPAAPGYVTVYPCGQPRPDASTVNYSGADISPNAAFAKIGVGGQVCVYSTQATDLAIDVSGFAYADGSPSPINPARFADTRAGMATVDGVGAGGGAIGPLRVLEVPAAGREPIPDHATAVMLNVTAIRPVGDGYLTVYPCGTVAPNASSVNYVADSVTPNAVLAKIGNGSKVCVASTQLADVAVDVTAYVVPSADIGQPPVPTDASTAAAD